MEDPFAMFPLEIWEMILDRVFDSETVYSVLQIFPQLDEAFQSKKHKWLLGKILPFIATWSNLLEDAELLKLRLGSKTWLQAMDNFLENQQPHFKPYHPDLQTDDQFNWNSKSILGLQYDEDEKGYYGGVKFILDGAEDYDDDDYTSGKKFLEEMGTHAEDEDRNPYLARSLSVTVKAHADQHGRVVHFLEKLKEVLERFGKHIWFFSISFEVERQYRDHALYWLARYLALLPNLRSLEVSCSVLLCYQSVQDLIVHITAEDMVQVWEADPAPLTFPSLESLSMRGCQGDALAHYLLHSITTPIRRLALNLSSWREDHSHVLSTVSELKLERIGTDPGGEWTRLRNLMSTLEAPQLVKLELEMKMEYLKEQKPVFIEDDILPWIKRFPSLKYFTIGGNHNRLLIQERGTSLPERDSLPSLQFLTIRDSFALSYNFLICLPSLQHLQFRTDSTAKVVDLSNENVVKIRDQIETGTMHKSNVWGLLPSLKSVSILNEDGKKESKCDREKYEYFKEHPDYDGFPDFRKDIARQLDYNAVPRGISCLGLGSGCNSESSEYSSSSAASSSSSDNSSANSDAE